MNVESIVQEAKDNFTLANFQNCLKLLHGISSVPTEFRPTVDLLTYRAYIAQKKYNVVINEIAESHEILEFRLVLLLAKLQAGQLQKEQVAEKLNEALSGNLSASDSTIFLIAATIFMYIGMPGKALQVLHQGSDPLCDAMAVQCLISIHRPDLASKIVRRMQIADEDSLPCQLSTAALCLTQGGDKLTEALNLYQELQEKYKPSTLLLNGQAAALMSMDRWTEAEELLKQALDIEPSHTETLINMLVITQHTGKSVETANRYISQLRDCDKNHPFLSYLDEMDKLFTEASRPYTVSISD